MLASSNTTPTPPFFLFFLLTKNPDFSSWGPLKGRSSQVWGGTSTKVASTERSWCKDFKNLWFFRFGPGGWGLLPELSKNLRKTVAPMSLKVQLMKLASLERSWCEDSIPPQFFSFWAGGWGVLPEMSKNLRKTVAPTSLKVQLTKLASLERSWCEDFKTLRSFLFWAGRKAVVGLFFLPTLPLSLSLHSGVRGFCPFWIDKTRRNNQS